MRFSNRYLNRKGQAVIEFAFVLPILLVLFIGIVFLGLAYKDYVTLSHTARDTAHAASLCTDTDESKVNDKYQTIVDTEAQDLKLVSGVYIFRSVSITYENNTDDSSKEEEYAMNRVVATINAEYDVKNSSLARALCALTGDKNTTSKDYQVIYSMYTSRTGGDNQTIVSETK